MKIVFVARAIDCMAGGVERVITILMNALAERGHTIALLTWDHSKAECFYPIAPEVIWKKLNLGDPSEKANLMLKLRRAAEIRGWAREIKPDVFVCFQDGPFMAIRAYTFGLGIPVIAAERNAPTRFAHVKHRRKYLVFNALRLAKYIIVQCESYKQLYPSFLKDRIVIIPNPVFPAERRAQPDKPNEEGRFRILSVGRLSYQKNYSVLIKAFATVSGSLPEWDLVIVGEGEERGELERLIQVKGISNRVFLPGKSTSISRMYISSHLFCLPSRWEGFPNALAEALAHGLPCIGFDKCAGMRDLITPGVNGLLADGNGDEESLTITLRKAMSSSDLRKKMGIRASESIKKYTPQRIYSLWEDILKRAITS